MRLSEARHGGKLTLSDAQPRHRLFNRPRLFERVTPAERVQFGEQLQRILRRIVDAFLAEHQFRAYFSARTYAWCPYTTSYPP